MQLVRTTAVLFATLLSASALAQPTDGNWGGPTFHQDPMSFKVSGGQISDIHYKIVSCNTVNFTLPGPFALAGSSFDTGTLGGTCPSIRVTGTFSSATTASGSAYISYTNDVGCPCSGAGYVDFSATPGIRGDANNDGVVNVGDVFYLISAIFAGGTPPATTKLGDANKDNVVGTADVLFLISALFAGGPPPA